MTVRAPDPKTLVLSVVLTVVSGATDVISVLRLGGVFTSVMTGNLVLLGLSAGRRDGELAAHSAVAIAGFLVGVLLSSRIVRTAAGRAVGPSVRPARFEAALAVELLALVAFLAAWITTDGRPDGGEQLGLLVAGALAMGMQSGTVHAMGVPGLSTTYLTGTLTGVLAGLATSSQVQWHGVALLAGLLVGAAAGGLLVLGAPGLAPVLPAGLLALVLLASALHRRT